MDLGNYSVFIIVIFPFNERHLIWSPNVCNCIHIFEGALKGPCLTCVVMSSVGSRISVFLIFPIGIISFLFRLSLRPEHFSNSLNYLIDTINEFMSARKRVVSSK